MFFVLFKTPLRCRLGLHRMIPATHGCTTHYCGRCGGFFVYA